MEKKKKPIEDEALDQITGGDGSQTPDFSELCKKGMHIWQDCGSYYACKFCNAQYSKIGSGSEHPTLGL